MKLFLFFSHSLTEAQSRNVKEMGVDEVVRLPEELQIEFSKIPPELEDLSDYVKPFFEFLLNNSKKGDYILIQGDFGFVYKIVEFSKTIGLIPIYSTTQRVSSEKVVDGEVIKTSNFKHMIFRKY